MPQGMDKFRYGLKGEKGAKSHGTGLGGYRVKSITRHYDGDYDVFCNRIQNTTTIRVIFPKALFQEVMKYLDMALRCFLFLSLGMKILALLLFSQ